MQRNNEKNETEKTRELSKKIRVIEGTFHERRATIKDGSSKDLTEGENIKKMWQEYTKSYTEKILIT